MGRVGNKRGGGAATKSGNVRKKVKTEESARNTKGKGRNAPKVEEMSESSSSESVDESEEDEGGDGFLEAFTQTQSSEDSEGMESTRQALKELQSMVEKTDKKDNFQKEFEKEVLAEEKRLLGLLDELEGERQAEREGFHNEFSSLLATAFSLPGVDDDEDTTQMSSSASSSPSSPASPASTEHTGRDVIKFPALDEHPIMVASRTLMEELQAMATEYDELTRQTANCEQPPEDLSETWEKDYAEVRRLISVGRKATESEVKRLLDYEDPKARGSGGKGKEGETDTEEFEKDEHLQAMLEMGREGHDREKRVYGWGNAAHRLVKGFRRLERALPDED